MVNMTAQPIQTIVEALNEQGVYLFVTDGKLKTKALPGMMTPDHVNTIKGNKQALIDFLSRDSQAPEVTLSHIDKSGGCDLSYSQQRLWFLDKFEQGSSAYNMPMALKLTGELNLAAVASAFGQIVNRHESLRTQYREVDEQVKQFIMPAQPFEVALTDVSGTQGEQQSQALQKLMSEEAQQLFDLSSDLMLRAKVIKCAANEHVLLITMHHIASDGWSLNLVTKEFCQFYNHEVEPEHQPQVTTLTHQYADYAHWQTAALENPQVGEAVAKFKQQLQGAPAMHSLPTDKPRPGEMTYNGDFYRHQLPVDFSEQLRQLARQLDVSLFALLESAYAVLLCRYSGADDIVIGTPTANRTLKEMEEVIGFFVNTLVLRHKITPSSRFSDVVAANAATLLDAYSLQHVPFEMMLDEINPERGLSYHPLFQTFIVFDNTASQAPSLNGLEVAEMEHYHQFAKFDLSLYLHDDDALRLGWEYNTDLYQRASIETMAASFTTLLGAIVANPHCPVNSLALVSPTEQLALINNADQQHQQSVPTATVISQMIARADTHPDAPALVFDDQSLNYRQLLSQVARLSGWLMRQSVKPGDRVAIYLPRKAEMVVSMLAVMACGAAYVPLDPDYPRQRLQHIVEDADVTAILTDDVTDASHFEGNRPRLNVMTGLAEDYEGYLTDHSANGAPAYLIYTSGSTGLPKGVVVTHANVSNLMAGLDERLINPGVNQAGDEKPISLLAVTSMSFDISVLELFWTLSRGHKVVLADSQVQNQNSVMTSALPPREGGQGLNFSLYYFATDPDRSGAGKYDLLLEGAKFADSHGFEAVWMPERHFHEFGGQFPNPTITAAALSQVTEHICLRAGSIVLPLHNPIQVAGHLRLAF
jgi:non-ribosomal peptide synthetase component F